MVGELGAPDPKLIFHLSFSADLSAEALSRKATLDELGRSCREAFFMNFRVFFATLRLRVSAFETPK